MNRLLPVASLCIGLSVLLLAAGGPTFAADEIHFTITGQTSVTFDWRGTASENTVRYGLSSGSYTQTVTAVNPSAPNIPYSSPGPFWEARLTGLQENTLYHYSIAGGPDHTFRTPPPRGSTTGFVVYAEGDIGDTETYPNVGPVQQLIAAGAPFAFALLVGDLSYANAHGQAANDQHFNDMMVWSQDVPYMPAWGNHEWDKSTDDLRNFKGRFDLPNPQTSPGSPAISCCGEDWYWFDYGNVRFIAYPEPWSGAWSDWRTKATQLMDAAQADPAITFIVTFGHRPSYSSGHHPGSATLAGYLGTLGANHSKYVLNIYGHSHNYERTHPQSGVIHLTVGTGGSSLEEDGSCLWAIPCAGSCPCAAPAYSAYRAYHLGVTKLQFTATTIQGSFICGPPGGGTNDVTCAPGTVIDTFAIGTPGTGDTTGPTVSVTAPAAGATVSGTVSVAASASDNVGVAGVQFKVDGTNAGAEDTTAPYAYSWNTTAVSNAVHTLAAVARDAAGNTTTATAVTVTVANSDTTAPTVSMTAPAAGATVSGTVSVTASASDNVGVVGVQFKVDGTNTGAEDTTAPYAFSWNTTAVSNAVHTLTAVARDAAGNTTTATARTVTVSNELTGLITDPSLVFTVPQMLKPLYLAPVREPTFNTTVIRVVDDPARPIAWTGPPAGTGTWGSDARHHYSKDQPWNSDETLLVLQNNGSPSQIVLDGETYVPRYGKCGNYSLGDDRWHPSRLHPHERINARGTTLEWFDVVACAQTRSWTLPFAVDYFGSGEGTPSIDGRYAALGDATRLFVVDMDPQPPLAPYPNKRIGPALDVSSCGLAGGCAIDWVSVSASGKYAVVQYNGDHPRVFDVNPDTLALTPRAMPVGSPRCSGGDPLQGYVYDLGHADLALNPFDGNEDVFVGQEHCGNRGRTVGGLLIGGIVMVRLRDGSITSLTTPTNEAYPHHVSARNLGRPGWVYVGYYQESGKRYTDEIVAVSMDGLQSVERLAHKRSVFSSCYRCESHAVPSPNGRRVLWAGNWAENCGSRCGSASEIQAYVLDTRGGDTTPPAAPANLRIVP